jgi:hypothetical protein
VARVADLKRLADTPELLEREMQTCKHFRGVQHERCAAGVELRPLRDTSGPGIARWPCLRLIGQRECATVCAKIELPTEAEARAQLEEIEQAVLRFGGPQQVRELESKRQAVIEAAKIFCGEPILGEVSVAFTDLDRAVSELIDLEGGQ